MPVSGKDEILSFIDQFFYRQKKDLTEDFMENCFCWIDFVNWQNFHCSLWDNFDTILQMVTLSVCTFRVHSWMKALDHFQGLRKAEGPFQRIFIHVDTLWSNDSNRKSNLVFEKTTIYTGVQKPFSAQKELQVGQKLVSYIESFSKWKCQFHWNKIEVSDMRFCIHTTWFCKDSILLTSLY